MRFTRLGTRIVGGLAAVHVDEQPFAPLQHVHAGNPHPLDEGRFVCHANYGGGWRVLAVNAITGAVSVVDNRPASDLYAGGGVWAAWAAGEHGYRDAHGTQTRRDVSGWCPLAVDDLTGTIALVTHRPTGTGLSLWNGSQLTPITMAAVGADACFRGGVLTYRKGGVLQAYRVGAGPIAIGHTPGASGARFAGSWLLLWRDGLYLVGWNDPTKGILVSLSDENFYSDLRVLADGTIEVIASGTQGDTLPVKRFRVNPTAAQWVRFSVPVPAPPEQDDADMTDAQVKDLFARLARIERGIADLQDDVDDLRDDGPTPAPPPSSPDAPVIDLDDVVWLHEDVSDWPVTSTIEDVSIVQGPDTDAGSICFPHSKAGQWPTFDNGRGEGNVWVFGRIDGTWYAACAEWLKPGQTCKRLTAQVGPPADDNWGIGPHTKKEPLKSWSPQSGEWIGIMVSTPARDKTRTSNERSQVFLVRWP